ncbi:MAG: DUF1599 domain-containing protein [bacterium]
MSKTSDQWWGIINNKCLPIYTKKHEDYGSSWVILRLPSFTDQIFIKAKRIRTIQEVGNQKVIDGIEGEYLGIVNYCIMALIRISHPDLAADVDKATALEFYQKEIARVYSLLEAKNHDYGEAWRDMRQTSFVDLILQKLIRIKQIEANDGKTLVSEGVDAGYQDIINYSIFALILQSE